MILDCTYLQTQKPKDHAEQRFCFSGQKKYSLCKPMMTVTPTGKIMGVDGPWRAIHNDASILNRMLKNTSECSIRSFVRPGDLFILDRGFRDSATPLADLDRNYKMPCFLKKKQKQFTTAEGNMSRLVTFLRWVVEVVNGRVKNLSVF